MLPAPKHRLAAILFADIVGYTAMMQSDEAAGIARASSLWSILNQNSSYWFRSYPKLMLD